MQLMGAGLAAPLAEMPGGTAETGPAALLRVKTDPRKPLVSFLSWDTEGGKRSEQNLLRDDSQVTLRIRTGGTWRPAEQFPVRPLGNEGTAWAIDLGPGATIDWRVLQNHGRLSFNLTARGRRRDTLTGIEVRFPFSARRTPTTVLPGGFHRDGSFNLPGILSAPDFGQMLMAPSAGAKVKGRLEGNRKQGNVDLILQLPLPRAERPFQVELRPVRLDPPDGLQDQNLWRLARRGCFNGWQPSSRWGEQDRPFSAPAGVLANNVVSDPCSMALPFYSDLALWFPTVAGVAISAVVRQTIEWWLDQRTSSSGVVTGYWDYQTFLDANSGPLIAAWDYVESTQELDWLARKTTQLEFIAEYYVQRDVDGDGLVEALQSGNRGTLKQPARSCCWWDAMNCGGKDGYSNALIYRAWRCLADLEGKLGRRQQQSRYSRLADQLKAAYAKALYNHKTGWLGWWRSSDGELHDYATPVVNGMAVEYGLVEAALGRKILDRLWRHMAAVGFTLTDLGFPCTLDPVHRSDYLLPDSVGCPKREDGRDTFQQYMNGGITAGQILHFLAAHYVVGMPDRADHALRAMLGRQARGGFQNGVRNKGGEGIDWTTWNGQPCGYEGYLADVYYFLQAVLLREPEFRRRYYRPLSA